MNDLTTHANYIPSIWPGMVVEFREANLVMANLVNRRDIDVANFGDNFYYPITSKGTAVTYAAGNRLTDNLQVDTDSLITLTINQFKMHPFHIPWNVADQVKYDTMAINMRQAGVAIAEVIDSYVHTVAIAGITKQINDPATSQATDITLAHILDAFVTLNGSDVPTGDRAWVFHPTAYGELLSLEYFTKHDWVDNSPMTTGLIGSMLGSPVYQSTNVGTSASTGSPAETGYGNLYIHRDVIALAMQRKPEMESEYDIDTQGILGNVKTGYGCVILRADHGAVLYSVND